MGRASMRVKLRQLSRTGEVAREEKDAAAEKLGPSSIGARGGRKKENLCRAEGGRERLAKIMGVDRRNNEMARRDRIAEYPRGPRE